MNHVNELISVVVPVYNVEKFLSVCIDSIINQSYKNLEIILVDDGSTDNCGKICDDYSYKDERIKVIHKQNGGLSDARNAGTKVCLGKYICYVDSDDSIEKDFVEKLYNCICKNNVLVSQCGVNLIDEEGNYIKSLGYDEDCVLLGTDMIKDTYQKKIIENTTAWNRMYDSNLMKKNLYPKGKIHEDEYVTYKVLYSANKIAITSDHLYNYRQRENSIMAAKYSLKRLDAQDALTERIAFFKQYNEEELYYLTINYYLWFIRKNYIMIKRYIHESESVLVSLMKEYNIYYRKSRLYNKLNLNDKIKNRLFLICPCIFKIIFKEG